MIMGIWEQESMMPEGFFAQVKFTNKGSDDDPSKYKCIEFLNHTYNILSRIIMIILIGASGKRNTSTVLAGRLQSCL